MEGVGTNRYAYAANDPVGQSDPSGHNAYVEHGNTAGPGNANVGDLSGGGTNGGTLYHGSAGIGSNGRAYVTNCSNCYSNKVDVTSDGAGHLNVVGMGWSSASNSSLESAGNLQIFSSVQTTVFGAKIPARAKAKLFSLLLDILKKNLGLKYPMRLNRAGKLQPYDPATGRFLPYEANPTLAEIQELTRLSRSSILIQAGALVGYEDASGMPPKRDSKFANLPGLAGIGYRSGWSIGAGMRIADMYSDVMRGLFGF